MQRTILHVDLDAFYAAVEVLDHPALSGKSVIVAGLGPRGVVSTASYEARRFGVRSAMPTAEARRRCPGGVFVAPRMARYQEKSAEVFAVLARYTPDIEPLSLDEAFLDLSHSLSLFGTGMDAARRIRAEVLDCCELSCSVGVAPNKLLAKLASEAGKPGGVYEVRSDAVQSFLDPMPIRRMWGIGPAMEQELLKMGVTTLAELRALGPEALASRFGSFGRELHQRACGIDTRPVETERVELSISAEETFALDVLDQAVLDRELMRMCERVGRRLRDAGLKAGVVVLKLRRADFQRITRQTVLQPATDRTSTIHAKARELLRRWRQENPAVPIRLLGVGVRPQAESAQASLFAAPSSETSRGADAVSDAIQKRFGQRTLTRARSLKPPAGED